MLANAAVLTRPVVLAPRAAEAAADVAVVENRHLVPPRAPWRRHHLSFRGTRAFTALMLGWAGVILSAVGLIAIPAANDAGRAAADAGLMALLGSIAPLVWALGIVQLVAAVGIVRDRLGWGYRLGLWSLAGGALVVVGGIVLALAGRDAFGLLDPATAAGSGLGLLAWTLMLYGLTGWGIRRILVARELL